MHYCIYAFMHLQCAHLIIMRWAHCKHINISPFMPTVNPCYSSGEQLWLWWEGGGGNLTAVCITLSWHTGAVVLHQKHQHYQQVGEQRNPRETCSALSSYIYQLHARAQTAHISFSSDKATISPRTHQQQQQGRFYMSRSGSHEFIWASL